MQQPGDNLFALFYGRTLSLFHGDCQTKNELSKFRAIPFTLIKKQSVHSLDTLQNL